jgi:MtfA peptidase
VTIAAQACLLVLGMEHNYFDRVLSILVYPYGYEAPMPEHPAAGVVVAERHARLGESHYRGPVVLSWADVVHDARHPRAGKNLVFHEFAHQLDMLDGVVNGTPPLQDGEQALRWQEVMTQEYGHLKTASARGKVTLLDEYGATNEAEFFAVATECFFDLPVEMARRHPRLYELLREYYRQDPATRCAARAGS